MKAFYALIVAVCTLSPSSANPAPKVGVTGSVVGRQAADAGIALGSYATNMATGLASQALGAFRGVPLLGSMARIGQAAIETGNNFAQMGMGIGQMAVNAGKPGLQGFGLSAQQQLATQQLQQARAQAAAQQQQLAAQQSQLARAQAAAQRQLEQTRAQQQLAQQQLAQLAALQRGYQHNGGAQQSGASTSNTRQTDRDDNLATLGYPELDSWWNPSLPQPAYAGN